MTRILVTGGTGFVGRPTVAALIARGHEVHVAGRSGTTAPGAVAHDADLLDADIAPRLCADVRATHLLHLAWYAEPGRFWHDADRNLAWVEATSRLARAFADAGGSRIVATGTAAEGPGATSVYAVAKGATRDLLHAAGPGLGLATAWGRLHQPYGPGEHPSRLIPSVVRTLRSGEVFEAATSGAQVRDFVHVDDVASALVAVVETDLLGDFAIGTGQGTAVREVVEAIARHVGAADRVHFATAALPAHEPDRLVADVDPLQRLGWRPRFDVETGVQQICDGSAE